MTLKIGLIGCGGITEAQAGKHLMTEKPLCLNLDEAAQIAKAVKESGIIMMAAHNQLFFPSVQQAKAMLFISF